jgi:hypothetical protein
MVTFQNVTLVINYFSTQARQDYLTIYDGVGSSSLLIANLSGSPSVPLYYSTSQQYMYLSFTSDPVTTYSGFSATFQSFGKEMPLIKMQLT